MIFTRSIKTVDQKVIFEILSQSLLFQELGPENLRKLVHIANLRWLDSDEVLLTEGQKSPFLYVLGQGALDVRKRTVDPQSETTIAQLSSGTVIGERKLFGDYSSSATVVSTKPSVVVEIPLKLLKTDPSLGSQREGIYQAAGRLLSHRLSQTSYDAANAIQSELEQAKTRIFGGRLLLHIVALLAGNSLIVMGLNSLSTEYLPSPEIQSFFLIGSAAGVVAWALKDSPFSRKTFGLSLEDAWVHARQATVLTLPVLFLLAVLKLYLIQTTDIFAGRDFFDPGSLSPDGNFQISYFAGAMLGYCIHVPLQEFIVRSGLQASLLQLIEAPKRFKNVLPILISNLVFAAFHSYLGLTFATAAFIPGLLWGWIFSRQGSLVGPIVSHLLIGLWGLFALGLHYGFGG